MTGSRIALPLGVAVVCAIAALTLVPRGIDAEALLYAQDDPALLVDRQLERAFTAPVAAREIQSALAANDIDLARSFLDLARDRNIAVDPALVFKVEAASTTSAAAGRAAESFGRGLITGEPEDLVGLAGTALGDLFVFGDIRDAVREGARFASGEPVDEIILGLACVGLAITAGTYASLGAGTPARIGASVVKAVRKTGRMTSSMAGWFTRTLREVVDWTALRGAIRGVSLANPGLAVRAAREAVKVEKTRDLVRVVGDVGRVQTKAGAQAAVDGLKLAQGPRDLSRVARLAETKGTRTRAVLKLFGRGALFLTTSAFTLFSWLFTAVLTLFGFCSACKRAAERATERYLQRRKARHAYERLRFAAMTVRG
ncbi:MAG: hypothetical protein QOG83_3071 [Alphaproteobacteria bacterium]|jgi:hypothetical protein|nr:hypothetical protein [Alphaproteobacteria bacterium]MEA2990360.1 hypothetical protein [Alphaproteobacteria bacterium]